MPKRWALVTLLAVLALPAARLGAQNNVSGLSPEEIQRRFELLEARILYLEGRLAARQGEKPPGQKGEPAPEQQALAVPQQLEPPTTQEPAPAAPDPEIVQQAELPMAEVIPTEGARSAELRRSS